MSTQPVQAEPQSLEPAGSGRPRLLKRGMAARYLPTIAPYLGLLALLLIWSSMAPEVFSVENLNLQSIAVLTLALAATGQTIVILLGGIDLSIAGVISLTSALLATRGIGESTGDLLLWIVIVIGIGCLAGLVNGLIIALLRLPPIVVTLATWSILNGLALWVLPTDGGEAPTDLITLANEQWLGLAVPVWGVLALALFAIWFRRTRLGVSMRALGSDRTAAFLSGVPLLRTTFLAYMLAGLFGALAGIYFTGQTATGSPGAGDPFVLTSVAAVVIGGTHLAGGRGGPGGSLIGAYILTAIPSVVFVLEISSFWTPLLIGLLLILSVLGTSIADIYARRSSS